MRDEFKSRNFILLGMYNIMWTWTQFFSLSYKACIIECFCHRSNLLSILESFFFLPSMIAFISSTEPGRCRLSSSSSSELGLALSSGLTCRHNKHIFHDLTKSL